MTEPRIEMTEPRIAYFSMEIALDSRMPTYAGGLGILAGDTLRSGADLDVPMCAVTLVHRKGFFTQTLDRDGWQQESDTNWAPESFAEEMPHRVRVKIEGREVEIRCWKYVVTGVSGGCVPVYLLDTRLPSNAEGDQSLTDSLYGGDERYRLCQEAILGIGGVRILRALGLGAIERFHMNEGHAALLTLELLAEEARKAGRSQVVREDIAAVRKRCVFTTHTPVPAGHDRFSIDLAKSVLGLEDSVFTRSALYCPIGQPHGAGDSCLNYEELFENGRVNMTYLALNLSHYVNGVATKHAEVSQKMFGAFYPVDSITNGVHAGRWACPSVSTLFDQYIPGWKMNNDSMRSAAKIPLEAIRFAHHLAKVRLCESVLERVGVPLDPEVLTLGFARRSTAYKRGLLLLSDMVRLREIAEHAGGIQIIYAGKAHPEDHEGKLIIQEILKVCRESEGLLRVVFLPNYDIELAKVLIPGVDVWVNTPEPPLEASGTSGMKAALNGVPSLSVLDGWWIEGWVEGVTGWAIDSESIYDKLADTVVPLYRDNPDGFTEVMRSAIALNGSHFNTQRMMREYVVRAYAL
jgi:starch phosphorylase